MASAPARPMSAGSFGGRRAAATAATNYIRREAENLSAQTVRLTHAAIVHIKAWATSMASIAASVEDAARAAISAKAPAIALNITRSAQSEFLYAMEAAITARHRAKGATTRLSFCRVPLLIETQDQAVSIRQKRVTTTSAFRLCSSPGRGFILV